MLETEEVDIDYFTPAGSTSLANIFAKSSVIDENKGNTSLKYVPPPPPEKTKPEDVKPTQWIFTCAVHGFEWINSAYKSRGKLGLAILNVVKTNTHSIILYDSIKTTISYVIISPVLNIHITDTSTFSYYDSAQKYWSIKSSEDDINKILQLLKDLQVTILDKSQENDNNHSSRDKDCKDDVATKDETNKKDDETDTDFDITQKTKDSILKRMANMGHSVLPPHGNAKECVSDSSDSSDINSSKTNIKHKPNKIPTKKILDVGKHKNEGNIAGHSRKHKHKVNMDGQTFTPPKNSSMPQCENNMNIFISEQKASNNELRINVNTVSDKLDIVLERLDDVLNRDKNNLFSSFQNDIVQKLIREYESKIKNYECIITSKDIDFNTTKSLVSSENVANVSVDDMTLRNKFEELKEHVREKDVIITELKKEIEILHENSVKLTVDHNEKIEKLLMQIDSLNETLSQKNKEIITIKNTCNSKTASNQESCDIGNKVKKIMNDTFDAISVNFDDKEAYSGENIKNLIAVVIKKTTIQALQEL